MSVDLSRLEEFAQPKGPKKRAKAKEFSEPWDPPKRFDFGHGQVLAFDQSLTACGWVALAHTGAGMRVVASGTIKPRPGMARGHEQNLRKGVEVFEAAGRVLDTFADYTLVHETPPVATGKMMRPESSLMSALSVRIAAHTRGREVTMLGAQPAKRLVCGMANADKTDAHASLALNFAPWIQGYKPLITNEATRDALMLALLHLSWSKR